MFDLFFPSTQKIAILKREEAKARLEVYGLSGDQIKELEDGLFKSAIRTLYPNNAYILNGMDYCRQQLSAGFDPALAVKVTLAKYRVD